MHKGNTGSDKEPRKMLDLEVMASTDIMDLILFLKEFYEGMAG